MELYAYPRTLRDILGLNRRYIIPRFQREYSWGEDELMTLWDDILSNLKIDGKNLSESEYFIGSIVLVGDDTADTKFLIVDGQQRITTITIFFSALTEIFKEIGNYSLMKNSHKYVEAENDDGETFLKLENENPKPFFQFRIQQMDKNENFSPKSDEENGLMFAYNFFKEKMLKDNLIKEIKRKYKLGTIDYIDLLKTLRNQVLSFKTIYITVKDEDDAYLIFETLNAKGKDLESIDLIKNLIFKKIRTTAAGDLAKESWRSTRNILFSKENKISMSQFYRHYWLSKYSFTRDAGLYEDFKKRVPDTESSYENFLKELNDAANVYVQLTNPQITDWKQVEEKFVFDTIVALRTFDVSQPRPLLMALLDIRNKSKNIKFEDFRKVIVAMEKFHFIFTAIASSRASNIESKYSTFARQIRSCDNKTQTNKVIDEIINYYKDNLPSYDIFEDKFTSLYYSKKVTSNKRIIQYILRKTENYYLDTEELTTDIISIEHIMSESTEDENIGKIGNLLPLDKKLNSSIGDLEFRNKVEQYKKSKLITVKNFIMEHQRSATWGPDEISQRSKELATLAYNYVWKIE
ncbi:DUF262 domain-containing protein [Paenibacillus azoreducens]|uniref:DUF262 domain-containing protein n=1 Tax=Paenibacillus azoreducens TaxID=116718 RepID=A0A919YH06_9BACL|nr:DUF262 domain-containing protein [Paenibacillus azoreducens]GIO49448.1 hypothetical protein J34TS1_42130 [Paenibacillus azoreducens]